MARNRKRNPRKVVLVHGRFDLLHIGHILFLQKAKSMGNYLIVGIHSDRSINKFKGRNPINKACDRAELLESLKFVNRTMIFEPENIHGLILAMKPDIYCKGEEYSMDKEWEDIEAVKQIGGIVKYIPYTYGYSTTNIINKIK